MYNMLTICSLYYKPKSTNIKGTFLREECSSILCTKAGFNNSFEWHTEKEAIEEYGDIITERAVLIQSKENYNQLQQTTNMTFSWGHIRWGWSPPAFFNMTISLI